MNGVMTPGVSAGSNHVGASETWMANVICPSGAAAAGVSPDCGSATIRAVARANVSKAWRSFTVSSVLRAIHLDVSRCDVLSREHTPPPEVAIIPLMKPSAILDDARSILDDTIQLRRRIHRHPEIGLTLPRTQAAVLEAIDGLDLDVRTGQRTTSVVARS